MRAGQNEEVQRLVVEKIHPLYMAVDQDIKGLITHELSASKMTYEEAQASFQRMIVVFSLATGLGLLLAGSLGWSLARGISRSLTEAIEASNAVAQGDLTQAVPQEGQDEIAVLMRSIATMKENLVKIIAGVRQGSESVASASVQISQGNMDLSSRTEQQASAVEQTAASMEQISGTVKQNAENVNQANQLALQASEVASGGGEVAERWRGGWWGGWWTP